MTLTSFIATYTGKAVSYDGIPADFGQCEQLVCLYWLKVFGFKCPPIPYAYELWTNPVVLKSFSQVKVGQEKAGDVGIFNKSSSIGSPVAGHTDIVIKSGFTALDSNWGGVIAPNGYPAAHQVKHTYEDVLGFLRYKGAAMPDATNINELARLALRRNATAAEINKYSKLPFESVIEYFLEVQESHNITPTQGKPS